RRCAAALEFLIQLILLGECAPHMVQIPPISFGRVRLQRSCPHRAVRRVSKNGVSRARCRELCVDIGLAEGSDYSGELRVWGHVQLFSEKLDVRLCMAQGASSIARRGERANQRDCEA